MVAKGWVGYCDCLYSTSEIPAVSDLYTTRVRQNAGYAVYCVCSVGDDRRSPGSGAGQFAVYLAMVQATASGTSVRKQDVCC